MKVSFLHIFSPLGFFSNTLKHYVGFGRFFKGNHLDLIVLFHFNCLWKQRLADFTLKLGEVVGKSDSINLLLDFAINPVF